MQAGDQDRLARVRLRMRAARAGDDEGCRGRHRGADGESEGFAVDSHALGCGGCDAAAGTARRDGFWQGLVGRNGRCETRRRPLQDDRACANELDAAGSQEQAFKNFQAVVEASGCKLTDVVKTTVFLQSLGDFAKVRAAVSLVKQDERRGKSGAGRVAALSLALRSVRLPPSEC